MQNYLKLIDGIRKKNYKPIYFLHGLEPYYIDKVSKFAEDTILTAEQKPFNLHIFYGEDARIETIITTARRYPVMSAVQVILIKEAQHLGQLDKLQHYLTMPTQSTILVVCYKNKTLSKRLKLAKLIEKKGIIFEAKKLYENQVPSWINGTVKGYGYNISPKAMMMLTNFIGNDLSKLDNELQKLFINKPESKTITPELVEKYIGISREFNNFELQDAIGRKNSRKAYQIVNYFSTNQSKYPIVVTIATLFYFFKKLLIFHIAKKKSPSDSKMASKLGVHPYFLKDYKAAARNYSASVIPQIITLLREYDLKSKGQGNASVSQGNLLRELVVKVMQLK